MAMKETNNKNSVNEIIPSVEEFSQTREEYIRSLEMSVQLLQREVEHLRNQAKPETDVLSENKNEDDEKFLLEADFIALINKCKTGLEVLNALHDYHAAKFSIMESNLYFFDSGKKVSGLAGKQVSKSMVNQMKNLEETGVIDWAVENKEPSLIPNLSAGDEEAYAVLILVPLIIKGNPIGLFVAKSVILPDSFNNENKKLLKSAADYAAVTLDNIRSSEEMSNMNKRLNVLNRQMIRSSEFVSIGRIAGAFANEISNPLQVIKANLDFLESGLGDTTRRIRIIGEQVKAIEEINSRLAGLASENTAEFSPKPVPVASIIDEVLIFSGSQLQRDGIKIEKEMDDQDLQLLCSKNQIEQSLLNILLFARDTMPDGGVITLGVYKGRGNSFNITIVDNGNGLDEAETARIFEPAGIDDNESRPSQNLFMTKNIIEQHKGKITAISELGKGTTFKITFPGV